MTSEQFRDDQRHIGCSGLQLAEWLGVTPEHISRWRNGKSPIPVYAERMIAALKTGWRP